MDAHFQCSQDACEETGNSPRPELWECVKECFTIETRQIKSSGCAFMCVPLLVNAGVFELGFFHVCRLCRIHGLWYAVVLHVGMLAQQSMQDFGAEPRSASCVKQQKFAEDWAKTIQNTCPHRHWITLDYNTI